MAIAYGNTSSTKWNHTNSCSLNAPSITGSDTLLLLGMSINSGTTETFEAVTYNSEDISGNVLVNQMVDFTQLGLWYVINPVSSASFVVDMTGAGDVADGILTATYFTGVDQVTPTRTITIATDPAASVSPVTASVTNAQTSDVIFAIFGLNDVTLANGMTSSQIGAGQTFILQSPAISDAAQVALCTEAGSTGTVSVTWSYTTNASAGWIVGAVPLIPSASSSGAEKKITEFTALTDPIVTDLLCIVDSTTSPASAKLTINNLLDLFISDVTMTVLTATSGATYAPPAEAKKLLICVVGGGGGGNGGAATDSAGGGGGGGGTAIKMVSSTAITSGVYVVGPGGGVSSAGTANAGVASTFIIDAATTMSGGGGGAGTQGAGFSVVGVSVAGGVGGTAANGDLNIPGKRGERGIIYSATNGYAGAGGDSVFGYGAASAGVNTTGSPGGAYGGGGCGGHASAATNKEGSAGAKGTIFVLEFYG